MNVSVLTPCPTPPRTLRVRVHERSSLDSCLPRLAACATRGSLTPLSRHPAWLGVLHHGLRHEIFCVEALEDGQTRGFLPLAFVRSLLFGRFLVSLPYLNVGGVNAADDETAHL